MSFKHDEQSSCQGKISYDSANLAMQTILPRGINKRNGAKNVKAYKCSYCGFYHVGHLHKRKMKPYKREKS